MYPNKCEFNKEGGILSEAIVQSQSCVWLMHATYESNHIKLAFPEKDVVVQNPLEGLCMKENKINIFVSDSSTSTHVK